MAGTETDFLELAYPEMGFLINKMQFFSSIFPDSEEQIKTRLPYFDGLVKYRAQNILTFNLDRYLRANYGCSGTGDLLMILLAEIEDFRPGHRRLFRQLVTKAKISLSDRFLAFKTGNRAGIKTVPLAEIKLLPALLARGSMNNGLLGLRFNNGVPAFYFIDIEMIAVNVILTAARKRT